MAKITRRGLVLGGGAAGVVIVGAVGARAFDQGLFTPVEQRPGSGPWREVAEGRLRGPMALVGAAILASSPHNTQPWRFHVASDRIDVHLDPQRSLGAFDPYHREMALGVGCAVENLVQAAGGQGLRARVTPGGGSGTLMARVDLERDAVSASPLAAAIPLRRVNRRPFDTTRRVEAADISALEALSDDGAARLVMFPADGAVGRRFASETVEATRRIVDDHEMDAWSARWTRDGRAAVDRERSGLVLANTGVDTSLQVASAFLPPLSPETQGRYWLNMTQKAHVSTAAGFGLILVRDPYDRAQALSAGRLWQRLHLQATVSGLAMQPLNQLPECVDRERQLGRPPRTAALIDPLLPDPAWRPTFAFRYGLSGETPPPSPRRPLEAVLV